MNKKKVFLMIGPDRSGSSVLANLIYNLNIADEMSNINRQQSIDNPLGYYEPIFLVDLNEKILKKYNYTNYDINFNFFSNNSNFDKIYSDFKYEIDLFVDSHIKNEKNLLKDPRLFKLHYFWEYIFNLKKFKVYKILTWKNIDEMIISLNRRSYIPRINYMIYIMIGLINLKKEKSIFFFNYNDFTNKKTFELLIKFFDLNLIMNNFDAIVKKIFDFKFNNSSKIHMDQIISHDISFLSGIHKTENIIKKIKSNKNIMKYMHDKVFLEHINETAINWKIITKNKSEIQRIIKKINENIDSKNN